MTGTAAPLRALRSPSSEALEATLLAKGASRRLAPKSVPVLRIPQFLSPVWGIGNVRTTPYHTHRTPEPVAGGTAEECAQAQGGTARGPRPRTSPFSSSWDLLYAQPRSSSCSWPSSWPSPPLRRRRPPGSPPMVPAPGLPAGSPPLQAAPSSSTPSASSTARMTVETGGRPCRRPSSRSPDSPSAPTAPSSCGSAAAAVSSRAPRMACTRPPTGARPGRSSRSTLHVPASTMSMPLPTAASSPRPRSASSFRTTPGPRGRLPRPAPATSENWRRTRPGTWPAPTTQPARSPTPRTTGTRGRAARSLPGCP